MLAVSTVVKAALSAAPPLKARATGPLGKLARNSRSTFSAFQRSAEQGLPRREPLSGSILWLTSKRVAVVEAAHADQPLAGNRRLGRQLNQVTPRSHLPKGAFLDQEGAGPGSGQGGEGQPAQAAIGSDQHDAARR